MKNKNSGRGKSIRKKLPRLPQEVVEILRKKGGAQSSKKGEKGYNRREKKKFIADVSQDDERRFLF